MAFRLKAKRKHYADHVLSGAYLLGNDYTQLYNDAFRPINGAAKHPRAMGGSATDAYAEIWDQIGPMFEKVMEGQTVSFEDLLVSIDRNGYPEDCYFDFSYSPIIDESGHVGGILVICMETTKKVRAIEELSISRQNIRNMVRQVPVGMCIIKGNPLMMEEINDHFLEIIGKQRNQFENTPYWEVLPEATAFYSPITDHVLKIRLHPVYPHLRFGVSYSCLSILD